MPMEEISKYFHYGMVDFFHFRIDKKATEFLESLGEKILLIAGNICSHSQKGKIFCKVYSTLPAINKGSYIPSRKRIVIDEQDGEQHIEQKIYDIENISDPYIFQFHKKTENIARFLWRQYRLILIEV